MTDPSRASSRDAEGTLISIASWRDWEAIGREDNKEEIRRIVEGIFREQLMGGLALLLIPLLLLIDFGGLSPSLLSLFIILDMAIWVFFFLEYVCRLWVAPDRRAYITSPWNIINLAIVGLPAVALVLGAGYGISRYFRVLRVMQTVQVLVFSGRKVQAHLDGKEDELGGISKAKGIRACACPLASSPLSPAKGPDKPLWSPFSLSGTMDPSARRGLWVDVTHWTVQDLPVLSALSAVPVISLEQKLAERACPRADTSGNAMVVFLKVPRVYQDKNDSRRWIIAWDGILLVNDKEGIITFSRHGSPRVDRIPSLHRMDGTPLSSAYVVWILMGEALTMVEDLVIKAEEQMMYLGALPFRSLPSNFLEMIYTGQKEISVMLTWVLHTRAALSVVRSAEESLSGGEDAKSVMIPALIDRCSSLSDNVEKVQQGFSSLVDFYLNTTSLQMNQVMKTLAVLTALTMVPTIIGGLLGMNLVDNPWPATLLQMVTAVCLLMVVTAWVYFNLGWLRR